MSAIEFQNGCIAGFFGIFRFLSLAVSLHSSGRLTEAVLCEKNLDIWRGDRFSQIPPLALPWRPVQRNHFTDFSFPRLLFRDLFLNFHVLITHHENVKHIAAILEVFLNKSLVVG
ncbi:MAG: hypothetical protein LBK41_00125 [Clostridiales bacterium]|jgi:hypothetical protein|nr:hypothetical protein [Clostridiales bacterium]